MAYETTSVVALQIDVSEAIANATELSDILDGLKLTSASIGTIISKAFKPIAGSLKNVQSSVGATMQLLTKLAGKLVEVKAKGTGGRFRCLLFSGDPCGRPKSLAKAERRGYNGSKGA